jgi:hypothetical protein
MSEEQRIAFTAAREKLRQQHGVRVVTGAEDGCDARALPAGVYGFTGAPGARELPLFAKPITRSTEVHKTADGEIYLLGYLTVEEAAAFESGTEPLSVELYPEPYQAAQALVAVPLARIDRRKLPARSNGNPMRTEIAPRAGSLAHGPAK